MSPAWTRAALAALIVALAAVPFVAPQFRVTLGNYIGLSATGMAAVANGESGVTVIDGASANKIGGEFDGEERGIGNGK